MTLSPLTAVSPVDGRYRRATAALSDYFSEGALIRYRVRVEIEYFIALCRLPLPQLAGVEPAIFDRLHETCRTFTMDDAARIKEIEKTTNHDVKAVEYFVKEVFDRLGLRIQGVHPLRPDLPGHQQHGHAPLPEGGLANGDAAGPAGDRGKS
jgi:adenylosuccinate lyase